MFPELARAKDKVIYPVVHDFYENDGKVHYIAHAIMSNGVAIKLGNESDNSTGGSTRSHPDQKFWSENTLPSLAKLREKCGLGTATITRIEIDCTLMPCDGQWDGCTFVVPTLVNRVYPSTPLRIFSHRDEKVAQPGSTSTKRYFDCRSNDTNDALKTALGNHGGWGWTS
ncbi:hypothetical protein P3W24_00340 [Luteibacter sp. PPL201]|uniref:Uncharacterized protein n=1 Tax=Luteibacter sahnii TaxID=3021977 RepID=A0ABT6B5M1_9GAMM|nr:hypothetical protein [Luteibacter sp. PPL193]MDY1548646.1 hypothetical protein [Luteibacter sp. PPL193]